MNNGTNNSGTNLGGISAAEDATTTGDSMQHKATARATLKSINRHFAGCGGCWDGWTFAAVYPQVAAEYERAATVLAGRPVHYPTPPTRRERRGVGMPARIYRD